MAVTLDTERISRDLIESRKEFLDRDDGIHLTDIEKPNIISAYIPPTINQKPIVLIKPVVKSQVMLNRVDDYFAKMERGTKATLKRFVVDDDPITPEELVASVDAVVPQTKAVANLMASSTGFVAQTQIAGKVKFTPFKFNVWSRSGSGGSSKEELRSKQIPVGTYIITLKTPVGFKNQSELSGAIPFKVDGKQAVLEKVKYYPEDNLVRIQIRIVQNLVLILSVIGASLVAGGYLIGNLEDLVETSVESVDRVVETSIVVAVVGGIGWYALKKFGVL